MRSTLLIVVGAIALVLSCASTGCLLLFGVMATTHVQSPIRNWTLAPHGKLHEELELGSAGREEKLEVELARYVAPYKTEPITCSLSVSVTLPGKAPRVLFDDAKQPSAYGCKVDVTTVGTARFVIDAENSAAVEAVLRIAPPSTAALGPFLRSTAPVFALFAAVGVGGTLALIFGTRAKRPKRKEV